MSVFDISGNKIDAEQTAAEQLTVKRNSEELVNQFLSVAQSYLNQNSIVYRDGNTIFYKDTASDGIDCSTYVGLCLSGYPFNKTPYVTGNYIAPSAWKPNSDDYNWAVCPLQYTASRFENGSNAGEMVRLACQLGNWMSQRNQVVPMTNGFIDVQPGDIVFWGHRSKSTGEWLHPTWFKHINHVGIILSKEDAPDTFEYVDGNGVTQTGIWNKAKYPYKHRIIEVSVVTPPCRDSGWLEQGQEDSTNIWVNNVNTVVLICRPDFGALNLSSGE